MDLETYLKVSSIPLHVIAIVAIVGAGIYFATTVEERRTGVFESNNTDTKVRYNRATSILSYEAELRKPSPCGNLTSDASVLPTNSVMNESLLVVNLAYTEPENETCAQVITAVNVTGEVVTDSRPGNIVTTTSDSFETLEWNRTG